jgi:hypothetical protein
VQHREETDRKRNQNKTVGPTVGQTDRGEGGMPNWRWNDYVRFGIDDVISSVCSFCFCLLFIPLF